jgi:hypothetical protein
MALIPRRLGKDEREVLLLLADSANGCTQSILMARGFAIGMLCDLVHKGLAMPEQRNMRAGRRTIDVMWLTITAKGRHWTLFLVEGIVLVLLGLLAIVIPPLATLAVTILIGWLLLISGVVGLVTTFWVKGAPSTTRRQPAGR